MSKQEKKIRQVQHNNKNKAPIFVLRDYQEEALNSIWQAYKAGIRRQLISLPTGCGKTVIFSFLPVFFKMKKKMLIIAHREELLFQAKEKIEAIAPDYKIGIEKAFLETEHNDDIVIASVQTIGRETNRIKKFNPDDFGIIVIDEAHHAIAPTYKNILNHFKVFDKKTKKLLLGFTATPKRGDGIGLEEIFEDITYSKTISDMISQGYLCDIQGYRINTEVDLEGVKVRMGDFVVSELSKRINTEKRNQKIISAYKKLAKDRKTVVFCSNVAHAQQVADMFTDNGFPALPVWGEMPSKKRAEVLKEFHNDSINVLTNCNLLTEGFDEPKIDCIIMARPTQSQLLYTQMIGRGTRIYPEKKDLMVIDISDNSSKHSLVTLPTLFGLNSKFNTRGENILKVKEKINKIKEQHQYLNIDHVTSLEEIDLIIEQFDIISYEVDEVVEKFSYYSWFRMPDRSFRLTLTNGEFLQIERNFLNYYEIFFRNTTDQKKGYFRIYKTPSLKDAFTRADNFVRVNRTSQIKLVKRNMKWRHQKATEKQLAILNKHNIQYADYISKGEASFLIAQIFAKERTIS